MTTWPIRGNTPNPSEIESSAQWLKLVLRSMNFQDKNAMKMHRSQPSNKKEKKGKYPF